MSMDRARDLLDQADRARRMPFHPHPGNPGADLRDYEQRDREVHQLHIRAFVEAAGAIEGMIGQLPAAQSARPPKCRVCNGVGRAFGADPNKPCEACGGRGTL